MGKIEPEPNKPSAPAMNAAPVEAGEERSERGAGRRGDRAYAGAAVRVWHREDEI